MNETASNRHECETDDECVILSVRVVREQTNESADHLAVHDLSPLHVPADQTLFGDRAVQIGNALRALNPNL